VSFIDISSLMIVTEENIIKWKKSSDFNDGSTEKILFSEIL